MKKDKAWNSEPTYTIEPANVQGMVSWSNASPSDTDETRARNLGTKPFLSQSWHEINGDESFANFSSRWRDYFSCIFGEEDVWAGSGVGG